jgi:hypothetical protein
MERYPAWEANSRSIGREITRFFVEPEGSLPFSQEPANGPYPNDEVLSGYQPGQMV